MRGDHFFYPRAPAQYGLGGFVFPIVCSKGAAVHRFYRFFDRFTVYRFFAQKAVKNGKNLH